MSKLEDLTLTELKELAKKNNIKNISKLKKDELITVLKQVINFEDTKQDEVRDEKKEEKQNTVNDYEEDENKHERQYDENGEPIVDYKLTNEGDEIVEGILDILPDGYGFLRGETSYQVKKMYIFLWYKLEDLD